MLVRVTTIDDIPAIDRIRQAVEPWHVASLETQRVWFTSDPPQAQGVRLTAEVDGEIVGSGGCSLDLYTADPGMALVSLRVHPDARRRGVASALYERMEAHLREVGARQVQAYVLDDADSQNFAVRRGFVPGATQRFVVVDPLALPPEPQTPPGVEIRTGAQVGPKPFYEVGDVAARDEPGDSGFAGMPYEDFLEQCWSVTDPDLSTLALVDGVPAAMTAVTANFHTGRALSVAAATLREFRGRGLVKLLKSVSLRAAAARGITAAFAANDELNAPMRAINTWLGYQVVGSTRSATKKLD